jgi:hypothetical protein
MVDQYTESQIHIFNASIKLIGKGGIKMITSKKLANRIDKSEVTIYRHFRSKVDILRG